MEEAKLAQAIRVCPASSLLCRWTCRHHICGCVVPKSKICCEHINVEIPPRTNIPPRTMLFLLKTMLEVYTSWVSRDMLKV